MRDLLRKFGISIGIGLFVLAVAIYVLNRGHGPIGGNTAYAFFVDENDLSHETVRPATDYPPIVENGRTYVKAIKRSDDGGRTVYIACLLKYSSEVQEALRRNIEYTDPNFSQVQGSGTFVRSPKPGSPWIRATEPEAAELMSPAPDASGKLPMTIYPSR